MDGSGLWARDSGPESSARSMTLEIHDQPSSLVRLVRTFAFAGRELQNAVWPSRFDVKGS